MTYLKMNGQDFSMYVNKLKVTKNHLYTARSNASGNTVIGYINNKFTIDVGIIPLDDEAMAAVQEVINGFRVTLSFLDPETKQLKNANCYISKQSVEYYTIQDSNVKFKAFSLTFTEL